MRAGGGRGLTGSTEIVFGSQGPASQRLLVAFSPDDVFMSCVRFSPFYRTKEKLSLSSVTYSNTIEPAKCFCRFDLTGTCNDDDCRW